MDKENKKRIREYYDYQIQEKKRMNAYEKNLDSEQAKIWQIDSQRYKEQEKEINDRVKEMNVVNFEYLKNQIENKKASKKTKMNDNEYAYNQKILEKILKNGTENVRNGIDIDN